MTPSRGSTTPGRPTPRRRESLGALPSSTQPLPLISILTVVYNGAATLEATIRSVVEQSFANYEYIVIDGASNDGTVQLLEHYASHIDYWVSEPDLGIYDAMNKALAVARGDFVLFLGADDELKCSLETIASQLKDASSVYYGDVTLATTGETSGGKFSRYRLMQENICHQAIFYPRHVYKTKPYDTQAGMLADHKYNLEVWGSGTRFVYLPTLVSRFNDTGASSGSQGYFEPIKMATIRSSLGPFFYALKKVRTAAVRFLKGVREST